MKNEIANLVKFMDDFRSLDKPYCKYDIPLNIDMHDFINSIPINDLSIFVLHGGKEKIKCQHCGVWQIANTKNEYEEAANALGYNPDQSPLLYYSDSYFDCEKCKETNFINYEKLEEYMRDGVIKFIDYVMKPTLFIFNEQSSDFLNDKYTLDHGIIYDKYAPEINNPTSLISFSEKLVDIIPIVGYEIAEPYHVYYPYIEKL